MIPYSTYVRNPFVKENTFIGLPTESSALPAFKTSRPFLPQPSWEGHPDVIACYWKAFELAFRNLRRPTRRNGFVAAYIDTAFNKHLFMWDSAFILQFARYGSRAFNFQQTLDNFYAKQHPDGFICREIDEASGADCFERFDPSATGPNIMPWAEWEFFVNHGDRQRLRRVFPSLVAYHQWMRAYRTWPDGSYWATGWACGMDNQPRVPAHYNPAFSHAHLVWSDTCFQQILSANLLLKMADVLDRRGEVADLEDEVKHLTFFVNQALWDDKTAFYYDRYPDGSLSSVKSIGAYWALLAGVVPRENLERFIVHLENPDEFNRPHRIPTLSANDPDYDSEGGYWLGSVWPPTNYMALRGLTEAGCDDLAHQIALNHLEKVASVFESTGTLWENYAPEFELPGDPAKRDFVGWSGLPPIAVMFEYVFGLRPNAPDNRLIWDVRLLDAHGVARYPFGADGLLELSCAARSSASERPSIQARSNISITLELRWEGGTEIIQL